MRLPGDCEEAMGLPQWQATYQDLKQAGNGNRFFRSMPQWSAAWLRMLIVMLACGVQDLTRSLESIIGGDSHTRMSKGVAFGADSGTVALALATGEASMLIPESVKVTFKGAMKPHMDFRDVVHATQSQMLKKFNGENVFQGRIIEVHIGTLLADQAFTFTDWTAEMKAKASICISQDDTLIESLNIAKGRIQIMIDKGMDNEAGVLQGLIDSANARIDQIKSGKKPPLTPDENAKYHAEFVVDLDIIDEPMIADPDVNNEDVSKRYTHDTIRELSYYGGKNTSI